jgi:hypothetical protein
VKDDFLNTHYYSHFNVDHGKPPKVQEKQDAMDALRYYIDELK